MVAKQIKLEVIELNKLMSVGEMASYDRVRNEKVKHMESLIDKVKKTVNLRVRTHREISECSQQIHFVKLLLLIS